MNSSPLRFGTVGVILFSLVFLLSISRAFSVTDKYSDQDFEADAVCGDCHDGYATVLSRGVHTSLQVDGKSVNCISCHTGSAGHIEDPTVDNIGNPSRMPDADVLYTCTACHQPHSEQGTMGFDPHIGQDLNCTSCHKVHTDGSLLLDDDAKFCGQCHVSVETEFLQRSNHPVRDGNVTCLSCHDFTQRASARFGDGENAACYQCHPDQGGPHLFEHGAVSSFTTDDGGCLSCHKPHGSPNELLLSQSNNGLCRQCHGVPPTHLTAHNGITAGLACMDCHSEVHGSFDNKHLLDPDIGVKIGDGPGSCSCHMVKAGN
jgi:DmsE family decaheme c-type cytochrome